MRTYVYIDGFNLYYGAVRGTQGKWLNLAQLCQMLLPQNNIDRIKYFTAHIRSRPQDPNQHIRQQIYLRALHTIPNLEIILGHFLSHPRWMPLANSPTNPPGMVQVVYTEEKGSDVNLATHLLWDGFQQRYDVAAIVTNDSDLVEPIRIVRQELRLDVIILNPHRNQSAELRRYATLVKPIRRGPLQACQFSNSMEDVHGVFYKPSSW